MDQKHHSRVRSLVIGLYLGLHVLLAAGVFYWTAQNWQSHDQLRFVSYLLSAIVASVLKVRLPGVTGSASVSFLFVLIGVVDLGLPEAIVIASLSMLPQCYFRTQRRPKLIQVCFSVATSTIAVYAAGLGYQYALAALPEPFALGVLSLAYYCVSAFSVAGIIALTESLSLWAVVKHNGWLLPYYAGATSLAWLIGTMPLAIQWEVPIICLPVVYLVHRSYRTYLVQIEQEKKHVEDLNALHMRTIETLALAIDAKDHTTHNHVQRVQLYAVAIGAELGLSPPELDALRAASVLHDIGKLAVPEHIISKPGKLTQAEFQKMKIHPIVGAEILERVSFPYPVVPVVRSHHEKWDGSGYPDGLCGEQIPIGARILTAVDCFDALSSDRQYRRALPLDEAMAKVASEAGTSFDPAVVEVLQRRYRDLEERTQASVPDEPILSTDVHVERGAAPAAGFAADPASVPAAALSAGSASLDAVGLEEAAAVAAVRIKRLMAYDAIALFVRDGEVLRSAFASGSHCAGLWALNVPVGMGMVGWVAEAAQPILNGNPSVEPGYRADGTMAALHSALAVPIVDSSNRTCAVLAVYRCDQDAFSDQQSAALMTLARPLAEMMQLRESENRRTIDASKSIGQLASHLFLSETLADAPRAASKIELQ